MRPTPILLSGLLIALAFPLPLHAQVHDHGHAGHDHHNDHEEQHGSLGAHQHGVATLNLVAEGNSLSIELDSPAANLVGFEHIPSSEADIARVKDTIATLRQADTLFVLPAEAGCALEEVELESPLFEAVGASHEHKHDHDHKHDHKHDHEHGADEAHADIAAHFHYECASAAALNQIEVTLFKAFPGTEKLILQAITPSGQQGGELTPAQNIIRF